MIYITRAILFITLLANSAAFASDVFPFDSKRAPSIEKLAGCSLKKCYTDAIVRDQNDPDFLKETSDTYVLAKNKYNRGKAKGSDRKESIFYFRQLALKGHIASMREMAKACLDTDKFSYKYAEALRWHVLAFHVEYLLKGQISPETEAGLENLMRGDKSKKTKTYISSRRTTSSF